MNILASALACFAVTIVLAGTANATYCMREPYLAGQKSAYQTVITVDYGSLTWLYNHGERGFEVTKSTASGPRVSAFPEIFRG